MDALATGTAERLLGELSDPVTKEEAARLLGISLGSVYDSLRRFTAARDAGDLPSMRKNIPCLHRGGAIQQDGSTKGGRYIVPRDAFIRWYTSAGLEDDLIERLYGEEASA